MIQTTNLPVMLNSPETVFPLVAHGGILIAPSFRVALDALEPFGFSLIHVVENEFKHPPQLSLVLDYRLTEPLPGDACSLERRIVRVLSRSPLALEIPASPLAAAYWEIIHWEMALFDRGAIILHERGHHVHTFGLIDNATPSAPMELHRPGLRLLLYVWRKWQWLKPALPVTPA